MYELFYIDKDGNYGEAEGLIVLDPKSMPDEWRDKVADAIELGKEETFKVINEYCAVSALVTSQVVLDTPKMIYSPERLRSEESEFLITGLIEGLA